MYIYTYTYQFSLSVRNIQGLLFLAEYKCKEVHLQQIKTVFTDKTLLPAWVPSLKGYVELGLLKVGVQSLISVSVIVTVVLDSMGLTPPSIAKTTN